MSTAASTSNAAPPPPPNTSLYVKNIPSKVKKDELRRQLYALFLTYGRVLDVVATRSDGMRGQAFIVFEDLAASTAALRALNAFSFYGQPLAIEYARQKSKATIVQERGPEALFDPTILSKDSKANNKTTSKVTFSSAGADLQGRERKRAREEAGQRGEVVATSANDDDENVSTDAESAAAEDVPHAKRRKSDGSAPTNGNGLKSNNESQEEDREGSDNPEA